MGVWLGISLVGFVLLVCALIARSMFFPGKPKRSVKNKHVVVTGGSSGIGKAVAIEAARMGAHVTIIARDLKKLKAARNEVFECCSDKETQRVEFLSLDISESYENVEKSFAELERTMGPVYMLVNCAGMAMCGKIEDTSPADLNLMINLNLIGTYNCIRAVVPKMKSFRDGIIILTSSQAAFLGIFGFSGYCCTKFALRGLAESISMELRPYNITVTLSLPPDTDTPGFATEELTKPLETKLISASSGLIKPEIVAAALLTDGLPETTIVETTVVLWWFFSVGVGVQAYCSMYYGGLVGGLLRIVVAFSKITTAVVTIVVWSVSGHARNGKFFSTVGLDGFILSILCTGMSPIVSFSDLILQAILMGPMRLISACYLISFQKIIERCMKSRDMNKKSK